MKCPFCGQIKDKVINSRLAEDGKRIRRRRECQNCKKRFTTFEEIDSIPIVVIKRDKRREIFDKQKILNGLLRACVKRNIPLEKLETIADAVERAIENLMDREIKSTTIGEMILKRLKNIDEVAYVRFASVYRSFSDITEFMDELKTLQNR